MEDPVDAEPGRRSRVEQRGLLHSHLLGHVLHSCRLLQLGQFLRWPPAHPCRAVVGWQVEAPGRSESRRHDRRLPRRRVLQWAWRLRRRGVLRARLRLCAHPSFERNLGQPSRVLTMVHRHHAKPKRHAQRPVRRNRLSTAGVVRRCRLLRADRCRTGWGPSEHPRRGLERRHLVHRIKSQSAGIDGRGPERDFVSGRECLRGRRLLRRPIRQSVDSG